jgi:ribose-phosphate pyrophosphokinase
MKISNPIIFSTEKYKYLQDLLCLEESFEKGEIERKYFPDGEIYNKLESKVTDRDIILIGGTISDQDTMEVYDLACAISKYGAKTLTLVIPYFGYSTMERAVKDGEVVKAKTRARLLSSIPEAEKGNRIIMIDLHAEGIPHYFEGSVKTVHLYAKPVIMDLINELAQGEEFVLASTDAGRAKWVESLANDMGVNPSFVYKKRLSGSETKVQAVSAGVEGKHVIIYDDMIRTGSSLINAAKAYLSCGATKISAVTTHGIFPNQAFEKIRDTNLFDKIACTDSHPNVKVIKDEKFLCKSIDKLLIDYLKG